MMTKGMTWRRGVLAAGLAAAGVLFLGGAGAEAAEEPVIAGQETVMYLDGKDEISVLGDNVKSVAYSSSDTGVAAVSSAGIVTPGKEGTAKIQAKVSYGEAGNLQTKELSYDLRVIDSSDNYFQYKSGKIVGLTTKGKMLKEVHIPGYYKNTKVTAVQENVFDRNQVVEKVYLSDHLEYMDFCDWEDEKYTASIFDECSNLKELHIGKALKDLGYLENISSLEKITIHPENQNFQVVDNVLFSGNTLVYYPAGRSDVSYTVPEKVTEIKAYAFSGAERLGKVKIPEKLKKIETAAFQKSGLEEIKLPLEITLEANAFQDCSKLEKAILPNRLEANGIFRNCQSLKIVIVPYTAQSVYAENFYGCSRLEAFQVTEGEGRFTVIDGVLFDSGIELVAYPAGKKDASYELPYRIGWISQKAFTGAVNLKKITLNRSLAEIGYRAFEDCRALTSIHIPGNTYLGDGAAQCFLGCKSLKEIKVGSKNKYHFSVKGVLYDRKDNTLTCYPQAKKGKKFTLPKTVSGIQSYAFVDNRYLQTLTMGKKVRRIEQKAFLRAKALRQVTLSGKIEVIGGSAFSDCVKLQKIVIPGKVKDLTEKVFSGCTSLREAVIGKSVKYVEYAAFKNCKSLRKLTFKGKKWLNWIDQDGVFIKTGSKKYSRLVVRVPKCTKKQKTKCKKALRTAGLHKKAKIQFAK